MNPILAIGQILISVALIAAILMQARGTGLSGTFGGDSAVYRSRRGVERRLWQFTVVLLVLFVAVRAGGLRLRRLSRGPVPTAERRTQIVNRRDRAVVAVLVLVLVVLGRRRSRSPRQAAAPDAGRAHARAHDAPAPWSTARASSASPSRSPR